MSQFDTPDALAAAVKAQHPVYASIPNDQLAQKVLAKYPQYWKNVNAANFAQKGMWQPASTGTQTVSTGQTGPESTAGKVMTGTNKAILSSLPTIGMTAGGIAGAPGLATGVAGAAAGAGLGKVVESTIEEKEGLKPKATPKEEAKSLAASTGEGALAELGGKAATKVLEKGAAYVAPKLSDQATKIMAKIIKPSARRLIAGTGRAETARQVSQEVANVAGIARNLTQLGENVQNAIDGLTAKTDSIVAQYKPQEIEVPVTGKTGAPKQLTSGAPQLTPGSAIGPVGGAAAAAGTAAGTKAGQATAKVFVRQGQINLNRILQRSGRAAAENLSETEFPDKTRLVKRAAQMIARHAGSADLSPSDALSLRRWLRSGMKWPKALNGMRDDVYSELNRQIGSFLSPEDRAIFESNNAQVHRLLIGKDAIDSAMHKALINPSRMVLHGGMGGWLGYEAGGRKGAIVGAALGAATGSVPFMLGEAATKRVASKAAGKVAEGMAVPVVKAGAQRAASAALMESLPNQ